MAYDFQVPGFLHAQDYSGLTKSIDSLFSAYAEGKLQRQQLQAGQVNLDVARQNQQAGLAQFQLQNGGLTPADVTQYLPQALQPQAQVPATPTPLLPAPQQDPAASGPWRPGSAPPAPVQMQPAVEDPKLATVRAILAMHQQGQHLGAAQQVAGLQKTQAEAQKMQSEASINDLFTGKDGAGNLADWASQLRKDVQSGLKSPSQAQSEASRLGPMGLGRMMVDGALKGLDTVGLENAYDAKKKLAESGAMPTAITKSLLPSLDILDHLADTADKSSWQTINKIGLKLAAERGDRTANAILTQANVISEGSQNIYGSGSDSKLAVFQDALNAAKTKDQLKDSTRILKADFNNRIAALQGRPTDSTDPMAGVGGKSGAKAPPAVGAVQGGYKFRGGNPALPASWSRVP